ncbi:uncharacterized protein [Palaemon carinicauda]|uniref:uncharacterized protein n=1 Tax=Palaemon carinicauda TaxID=392227 RepID=UPI0035B64D2E
MEDKVKPILKKVDTVKRRKRLSFAAGLQGSPSKSRDSTDSSGSDDNVLQVRPQELNYSESADSINETQAENVHVSTYHKNITVTNVGVCYVPSPPIPKQYGPDMPIIPMKDNRRNIFVTALKSKSSAKVLISGHQCEGVNIKEKLLELQDSIKDKGSLKWEQSLDIVVEESLSVDSIISADYFIFLVHLYHMDSIKLLKEKLTLVESHAIPSIKGTILFLTRQAGMIQNVISYDNVSEFLDKHHIYYIQWTNPHRENYLKLLNNIHESTGLYSGVSLLTKSILRWNDKYIKE